MFGRQQQPEGPDWADMHFHQKVMSLFDSTSDFICNQSAWWFPVVGGAALTSLYFFTQDQFLPTAASMVSIVASPVPPTPMFGVPQGPPGAGAPAHDGVLGDDDFAEDLDD